MLTSNLMEIISVVYDTKSTKGIKSFSSEEIRDLSGLLLHYIRLSNSTLKTPNDTSEDSRYYQKELKKLLHELTGVQSENLYKTKAALFDNLISEFDYCLKKIKSHLDDSKNSLEGKERIVSKLLDQYQCFNTELKMQLNRELKESFSGFMASIKICLSISSCMTRVILELIERTGLKKLATYQEQLEYASTSYLKKMTFWHEADQTNNFCISFVASGDFIDALVNG